MHKTKIKILVDAHLFDGIFQGSRTFLRGLYRSISQSENFIIYLAAQKIENLEKEFEGCGELKFIQLKSQSKIKRLAYEIPALISRYDIDYAHFQYIDPLVKMCNTIITIHDVLFLEFTHDFPWLYRQKKYLFKLAGKRANILTTDSLYSKKRINQFLGIDLNKINVLQPGLDPVFFSSNEKEASKKRIEKKYSINKILLYVSRIEPRKNQEMLLKAFLDLSLWERGFHLVFIGEKAIKNENLESRLSQVPANIKNYIHHIEVVGFSDLIDLIRASDLVVYPSRAEGFGFPPLEAAALGTETILSNSTCLSEFHFFKGRFFDPDNVEELKIKIEEILDKQCSGLPIGELSEYIKENYNWDVCAENFEKIIMEDWKKKRTFLQ